MTFALPRMVRGETHERCTLIFTGQHGDYHWLSTAKYDLASLLHWCPEVFVGKYIAITSFDCGPFVPLSDEERAWLNHTQHKCDHAGDDEAGGTLQGVEIDQCNLDETILRTVYLRGLR